EREVDGLVVFITGVVEDVDKELVPHLTGGEGQRAVRREVVVAVQGGRAVAGGVVDGDRLARRPAQVHRNHRPGRVLRDRVGQDAEVDRGRVVVVLDGQVGGDRVAEGGVVGVGQLQ